MYVLKSMQHNGREATTLSHHAFQVKYSTKDWKRQNYYRAPQTITQK
ncbi:hypothetical protein Bhyg_14011, partial [Pseudolycoriella hygida]